jgi:ABC-type antimicrobial peptide transport system permease subunit
MLRNYIKIAWRSLTRTKRFSIINISGLAIGMAGAALILLWIQHEFSFDRFHANRDRLYEVYGLATADHKMIAINQTEQPLGPALKKDYPEIENTARVAEVSSLLLSAGAEPFTGIKGAFTDSSFFSLFSFPVAQGEPRQLLAGSNEIVITARLAKKLFGKEPALNKMIKIDSVDYFRVAAVLKDLPSNTRFDIDYLLPWSYLKKVGWSNDSWLSNNISTFVLLQPNANAAAVDGKIKDIARHYSGRNDVWTHFLFPLDKWRLYSVFENGRATGGRIGIVRLFGIVAVMILLIACINFVNLSTAKSERRAREVGIRKVAGAGKSLLFGQFMTEALLTALIAGCLAMLLVEGTIPYFNLLIDTSLDIPYSNIVFWLCAIAFILLTGLLAGWYPAFYLSAFKPVSVLKGGFKRREGIISPRKALVVFQFTFAVVLIICTVVIRNQIQYAQERSTGYVRQHLINIDFSGDIEKNYALIKQELLSSGVAVGVTKTMSAITQRAANTWGLIWDGKPASFEEAIALYSSDADLVKTAGLQLVAGRDIDIQRYPADSFSVVLNETAVRTMGFKDPLGQLLREKEGNRTWHVVGVVKDYVVGSSYERIPPVVIQGPGSWFNTLHIRFDEAASMATSLKKAEEIFKRYNPAYPFNYQFADQQYAVKFDGEERTKKLAGLFAILAIFISCLGLLGLSAYVAETRIKEIGVRKALGASVLSITHLLTADFLKLVIVAIMIATPLAWWLMSVWLDEFAYRMTISWSVFAFSGSLAIVIALLTVSFEVVKAALVSPIKSLKAD